MNPRAVLCFPGGRRQRGNALILALLALVVTGLSAATALQARHIEAKRASGLAEASVLEALRNAAQAAVYEHLAAIQQGQPIEKSGIVVTPTSESGELTWSPTVVQLRDMGYLPSGWSATRSTLNDGPYQIAFHRIPAGCPPAACDVQGMVVLGAPVLDVGRTTAVDGVVIGPILTKVGVDGGVSLPTSSGTISGFHATWTAPNPLIGTPLGVVGVRFGTQTGGFSQFVRIGDVRDPQLRGNLTTAGNFQLHGAAEFGGSSTFLQQASFQSDLTIGAPASPCVTASPTGQLTIACSGELNARQAVFADGAGNHSSIASDGVFSSGRMEASAGLLVRGNRIFDESDPRAIRMENDELLIRSPAGVLAEFRNGDIRARAEVSAQAINLTDIVDEESSCYGASSNISSKFAAARGGGLATCINGRWLTLFRVAQAGQGCSTDGLSASDVTDGQALLCRSGTYIRANAFLSNFVLIQTLGIQVSSTPIRVPKPDCAYAGSTVATPLIILTPNSEDAPITSGPVISGINRFAFDTGTEWEVRLERSADFSPLAGRLVASIFCFYG